METHQETSRQNYSIVRFQAEMTVRYCKSQVTLWAFLNHRRFFHRHLCESFATTSDGEAIMRSQKDCLDNYGANCSGLASLMILMELWNKPTTVPTGTLKRCSGYFCQNCLKVLILRQKYHSQPQHVGCLPLKTHES